MIKPTHYDDDGYPILWYRSAIPSNTLACLNGLAEDAHRRNVLGPDVEIRLHTYDETNRRAQPERIIREIRNAGGKALIGLVGVQSNQFPRAIDLARPFLAAGLPVCIGGFHISGCIAMLPEMPPDMREAQALGISFFAGEAEEGRFDAVLRDAWEGKLAPLYNHMDKLPNLQGQPPPILPRKHVRRTSGSLSSMDLGRGCPYQCSFCTIINVQGRKSRFYSRYFGESVVKMWRYWSVYRQCKSILDEVMAAPDRWTYTDLAIAPPRDDEFEALDLYHATAGGEAALARKHRDDAIRKSAHAAIWQGPATSTAS
jgi:hypothetical protein